MAKREPMLVTGKVGNVIFYTWKGIPCVRSVPRRVRQTKATKQSAKHFGHAVELSQFVRVAFKEVIGNYKDRAIMLRLNTALFHWLRQEKPQRELSFVGFEFDPESELKFKFQKTLECEVGDNGIVKVTIPAFKIPADIVFPTGAERLQFTIGIVSCDLAHSAILDYNQGKIEIPLQTGETRSKKVELRLTPKGKTINMVAAGLRYLTKEGDEVLRSRGRASRSAAIICAWVRK